MSNKVTSAKIPSKTLQRLKEQFQVKVNYEQHAQAAQNTVNQILLALFESLGFESEKFDDYTIDIDKGMISLKEVKTEVDFEDVEIVS